MPKQTETLSVFLLTGSDEEDPPSSAAAFGLTRLQLPSFQLVVEMFLVHFCPHLTHSFFFFYLCKTVLSRQAEEASTAPGVQM